MSQRGFNTLLDIPPHTPRRLFEKIVLHRLELLSATSCPTFTYSHTNHNVFDPPAMADASIDYSSWSDTPYKPHQSSKSFKGPHDCTSDSVDGDLIQPPSTRERQCLDRFEDHAEHCYSCATLRQDNSSGRLRCSSGDELAIKMVNRLIVHRGNIYKARHWAQGRLTLVDVNAEDFPHARPFFDLTLSRSQSCQSLSRHRAGRDVSRVASEREDIRSDTVSPSSQRRPSTPSDAFIGEQYYAHSLPDARHRPDREFPPLSPGTESTHASPPGEVNHSSPGVRSLSEGSSARPGMLCMTQPPPSQDTDSLTPQWATGTDLPVSFPC